MLVLLFNFYWSPEVSRNLRFAHSCERLDGALNVQSRFPMQTKGCWMSGHTKRVHLYLAIEALERLKF